MNGGSGAQSKVNCSPLNVDGSIEGANVRKVTDDGETSDGGSSRTLRTALVSKGKKRETVGSVVDDGSGMTEHNSVSGLRSRHRTSHLMPHLKIRKFDRPPSTTLPARPVVSLSSTSPPPQNAGHPRPMFDGDDSARASGGQLPSNPPSSSPGGPTPVPIPATSQQPSTFRFDFSAHPSQHGPSVNPNRVMPTISAFSFWLIMIH